MCVCVKLWRSHKQTALKSKHSTNSLDSIWLHNYSSRNIYLPVLTASLLRFPCQTENVPTFGTWWVLISDPACMFLPPCTKMAAVILQRHQCVMPKSWIQLCHPAVKIIKLVLGKLSILFRFRHQINRVSKIVMVWLKTASLMLHDVLTGHKVMYKTTLFQSDTSTCMMELNLTTNPNLLTPRVCAY